MHVDKLGHQIDLTRARAARMLLLLSTTRLATPDRRSTRMRDSRLLQHGRFHVHVARREQIESCGRMTHDKQRLLAVCDENVVLEGEVVREARVGRRFVGVSGKGRLGRELGVERGHTVELRGEIVASIERNHHRVDELVSVEFKLGGCCCRDLLRS